MIFLIVFIAKLVQRRVAARKAESTSGSGARSSILVGVGGPQ